jgi:hypothetical protein
VNAGRLTQATSPGGCVCGGWSLAGARRSRTIFEIIVSRVGQSKRVSQYTCWYSLPVIDCVSDYWAKHPPMLPVARTRARAARPGKGESESGYTAMSKSTVKRAARCMF